MHDVSQRPTESASGAASAPRRGAGRIEFRRAFLRGLAVLLPSLLTLWILVACYQFVSRNIAEPINGLARTTLAWGSTVSGPLHGRFEPSEAAVEAAMAEQATRSRPARQETVVAQLRAREVEEWWQSHWWADLFGLAVALVGIYAAGRLVGGWVGRRLFTMLEGALTSLPILRQVYPSVKQIVGFFFSDGGHDDQRLKFSRVVVVQYPRQGIWSIGLLTGPALRSIEEEAGEALTVFIPSSPTPFTGYTITVKRSELHELPMTIDEAIKYLVSGGVVVPPNQERTAQPGESPPQRPSLAGT